MHAHRYLHGKTTRSLRHVKLSEIQEWNDTTEGHPDLEITLHKEVSERLYSPLCHSLVGLS